MPSARLQCARLAILCSGPQVADHVWAIGSESGLDRDRSCPRWLHQMRSDLGRLDATVEILQPGPFLGMIRRGIWGTPVGTLDVAVGLMMRPAWRRSPRGDILPRKNARSVPMRVFRIAAAIALLTGPAYAQMSTPNINLLSD